MRLRIGVGTIVPLYLAALVAGCGPPPQTLYRDFQDEDPKVRISAAVQAAKFKDAKSVAYLIDRLGDSEEDVRLVSYLALKEITGKTMGWKYHNSPELRAEAVARWREWLIETRGQSEAGGLDGDKQ